MPDRAATLSLKDAVGQLFMVAFEGTDPRPAQQVITTHRVGGVYVSDDNFTDPEQAVRLIRSLQETAARAGLPPLLVAGDQEGAWALLTRYLVAGPGNMALGATHRPELAEAIYGVFARQLGLLGFNADLAPVADVNANPQNPIIGVRSFGERPGEVAQMVAAAVRGLQTNGLAACAKHFPGHGDTALDSHRGLAVVDKPRDVLHRVELLPFREAIRAGVAIVMTAHLIYPAYDPDAPATLSPAVLQGLLRGELGFDGAILTDSFNMGAIVRHYDPADAAARSIAAGADMILLAEERYGTESGDPMAVQKGVMEGVWEAARSGRIPEARIRDAAGRVLTLKARYAAGAGAGNTAGAAPDPAQVAELLQTPEFGEVERRAALAAIAVEPPGAPLLPPTARRVAVVSGVTAAARERLQRTRGIGPNPGEAPVAALARALAGFALTVARFELGDPAGRRDGVAAALGYDAVVFATENYPLPGFDFEQASQAEALAALLQARGAAGGGPPILVVGFRDPYELTGLPRADAYVAAFGYRPACAEAVARVLTGRSPAEGRMPVSTFTTG